MPQKQIAPASFTVPSTSTSGQTAAQGCDCFDAISLALEVQLAAGLVALVLQVSVDGQHWAKHPDASATTVVGTVGTSNALLIARAPLGMLYRLSYSIGGGPVSIVGRPLLSIGGL